ncbi:phage tail sheath family protein [Fusibacter paucivorans]|uniref:Phage tail sheath family protein n=1 Tax=Fusibacter paucivorans TaxID=76009 RepID=A0ABS5PRR1_9FIRM|nr:phage tail sheath C-terminal domain-containing protein [Fusibacter paucivorans]MBS7527850.1 phage tail sheath family protein [Fusibacter paucivorans]
MALGGGTFVTQNKVLPGAYINFVSAANASAALSDRGIAAVPMNLDWGEDGIITLDSTSFQKDSLKMLGYAYDAEGLKDLREIFRNASKVYVYRLNAGDKATATAGLLTATAKYAGTRGNDLKIVVAANADDELKMDVSTYLETKHIETQTVSTIDGLVSNDFINFSGTGDLTATTGVELTGGTNLASVTGTEYQAALDAFESYGFNVLICPTADTTTEDLFIAYAKRLRDENGIKFQVVVYRRYADHEGVISVENTVTDADAAAHAMVYWVGGAQAAAAINKSTTNKTYDGEYAPDVAYTQSQLAAGITAGKYMLHRVDDMVKVLSDINTFVSFTSEKSSDFASNQVIRILDQVANDTALIFAQRYLGKIQNSASGRNAFWSELVAMNKELQRLQAIENFVSDDLVVEAGEAKDSVVVTNPIDPVVAMAKIYMTTIVN